ncbi:MAG: PQQ-dependent sugar dehydrogenase, partial [Bacteroidota bacterium]
MIFPGLKSTRIFIIILTLLSSAVFAQGGSEIYRSYCAGCHGAQLQGGSATGLIKTDWAYGRGKGAMIRNIRFGIPGTEMAAWNQILSDEQIRLVADYIVEAQDISPQAVRPIPEQLTTEEYGLEVEEVISEGLSYPWGITFIDNQQALISERNGNIRWLVNGQLNPKPVQGLPPTHTESSTGGYMDIILDPAYDDNGWVYLAYS